MCASCGTLVTVRRQCPWRYDLRALNVSVNVKTCGARYLLQFERARATNVVPLPNMTVIFPFFAVPAIVLSYHSHFLTLTTPSPTI